MSTRRAGTTLAVLVSILVLSGLLRLAGIGSGLPHVVGVDEGFEVHRALKLGAGEIDFERDAKGGFFYLLFVEYGVYFIWLFLTGQVSSPTEFAQHYTADLTPFWLIGRVSHAILGLLTVYATYRLGRRAYGERTGLFGAAVVGVSLLHVARSHYIGVDIPMTLLVVLALGLAYRWSDSEEPARPWALGAVFGFAVMTKIIALAALVPIAVAHWLRRRGDGWLQRLAAPEIVKAYVVSAVVFVVGNPGFVINLRNFFGEAFAAFFGVGVETDSPGSSGTAGPNLWLFYLRVLQDDLGFALFTLALAGVVLAIVRRSRADLILLGALAAFYLLIAGAQTSHLFYPRYALPLLPPLALLAGRLLDRAMRGLPFAARVNRPAVAVLSVLLLLPATLQSAGWLETHRRPDSRVQARGWFEENVPPGTAVFLIGNPLVDTAPNLSLPLRNTAQNLDTLIRSVEGDEPAKAQILEWRKESATGVPFDLRTVRHFDTNRSLDDYLRDGVDYFVLDSHHFEAARLARDRKHTAEVLESRAALADQCRTDPRIERVWSIDARKRRLSGPSIEVFRVSAG